MTKRYVSPSGFMLPRITVCAPAIAPICWIESSPTSPDNWKFISFLMAARFARSATLSFRCLTKLTVNSSSIKSLIASVSEEMPTIAIVLPAFSVFENCSAVCASAVSISTAKTAACIHRTAAIIPRIFFILFLLIGLFLPAPAGLFPY